MARGAADQHLRPDRASRGRVADVGAQGRRRARAAAAGIRSRRLLGRGGRGPHGLEEPHFRAEAHRGRMEPRCGQRHAAGALEPPREEAGERKGPRSCRRRAGLFHPERGDDGRVHRLLARQVQVVDRAPRDHSTSPATTRPASPWASRSAPARSRACARLRRLSSPSRPPLSLGKPPRRARSRTPALRSPRRPAASTPPAPPALASPARRRKHHRARTPAPRGSQAAPARAWRILQAPHRQERLPSQRAGCSRLSSSPVSAAQSKRRMPRRETALIACVREETPRTP